MDWRPVGGPRMKEEHLTVHPMWCYLEAQCLPWLQQIAWLVRQGVGSERKHLHPLGCLSGTCLRPSSAERRRRWASYLVIRRAGGEGCSAAAMKEYDLLGCLKARTTIAATKAGGQGHAQSDGMRVSDRLRRSGRLSASLRTPS